ARRHCPRGCRAPLDCEHRRLAWLDRARQRGKHGTDLAPEQGDCSEADDGDQGQQQAILGQGGAFFFACKERPGACDKLFHETRCSCARVRWSNIETENHQSQGQPPVHCESKAASACVAGDSCTRRAFWGEQHKKYREKVGHKGGGSPQRQSRTEASASKFYCALVWARAARAESRWQPVLDCQVMLTVNC